MNHIRLHLLQILRLEICERGRLSKPRTVRLQFQHAFLPASRSEACFIAAPEPRPSVSKRSSLAELSPPNDSREA